MILFLCIVRIKIVQEMLAEKLSITDYAVSKWEIVLNLIGLFFIILLERKSWLI